MNSKTTNSLNRLNQEFYNQIGPIWNPDNNYYWEGWEKLLIYFNNTTPKLKVLDLGCGNARFFGFLQEKFPRIKIEYLGVDNSDFLLTQASKQLVKSNNSFNLIKDDILKLNWQLNSSSQFDLIVMFGLIHHIPGNINRLNLFNKVSTLLNQTGKLIFTTYQFLDLPRLKKRVVDFNQAQNLVLLEKLGIDLSEFEWGDYILDWVKLKTSYRYCHYFNQEEITKFLELNSLHLEKDFLADDRQSNRNHYYVTRKQY